MTPMLAQYSEWKDKYPNCILLFRMGDFFEMFFDDAVKASEILDITLTARDQDRAVPMAGVPHHALDAYIGRLISAGLRVAICDQVTEPDGRNLVERKVIRVVTPGTYVPQDAPDEGRLAAVHFGADNVSIALLTSGAGKLEAGTFPADEAVSHIMTFSPGEILVPRGQESAFAEVWPEGTGSRPSAVSRERSEFSASYGAAWLCKRWNIPTLHSMGVEDGDHAAGTAAAVLRYLEETQFGGGGHVHEIRPIIPDGMLILDHSTQANLELFDSAGHSLYSVLNRCATPMGRRLLKDWMSHPSRRLGEISFRHDCVEFLVDDNPVRRKLVSAMSRCGDMERAISRLSMKVGNPKDLGVVRDTLSVLPEIRAALENAGFAGLGSIFGGVSDLPDLRALLYKALIADLPRNMTSAVIRDGFDPELDDYRDAIAHAEENLKIFEASERERTGLKVRVGKNSVFGYYIELGKNFADKAPLDYVRRQTVTGGERFVNERLKEIERRIFRAEQDIGVREEAIYKDLVSRVLDSGASCQASSSAIAVLDVLCSLAEAARDNAYVRPEMDESRIFKIRGARHPVIERSKTASHFTPNDITLDPDASDSGCIAVITGPNMAGKSTYLRTAALVALMAHMGSFVPAEEARIGIIDRIFTRIGARDELSLGRSTFMVEMVETANILRHVTPLSLVILDEIGRGTSTYDGMSIAWAVLEFLDLNVEGRTKALFATHYHELTNLSLPQLVNLSMAVEESKNGIRFLHKVTEGPADRSYGVEVARLAGVPSLVVTRAQEILDELERSSGHSRPALSEISRKNAQKEIFFDAEREGVIEELSQCDPNRMTPIEALGMISRLRKKSREILGLK